VSSLFLINHIQRYRVNLKECMFLTSVSIAGPPREFLGPRAERNLAHSSNYPNNDTQTKSTTVCHKQGNQYQKNQLMNCDLENRFLLVCLSGPLIIMYIY
jgi:hypothetical protein